MNYQKEREALVRIWLNARMQSDDQDLLKETNVYSGTIKRQAEKLVDTIERHYSYMGENFFKDEAGVQACVKYWEAVEKIVGFVSSIENYEKVVAYAETLEMAKELIEE